MNVTVAAGVFVLPNLKKTHRRSNNIFFNVCACVGCDCFATLLLSVVFRLFLKKKCDSATFLVPVLVV